VASIEDLPFAEGAFDVVVALGVLEYVDCPRALREMSRVVRPGSTAVVTMLNPTSPYRLFEWCVYWPARRPLGRIERLVGIPARTPPRCPVHRNTRNCRGHLHRLLRSAGLHPIDVVAYDVTPLVPPIDRLVRRWARQWRQHL
jgi:SAM-dependent methyltransferase